MLKMLRLNKNSAYSFTCGRGMSTLKLLQLTLKLILTLMLKLAKKEENPFFSFDLFNFGIEELWGSGTNFYMFLLLY